MIVLVEISSNLPAAQFVLSCIASSRYLATTIKERKNLCMV
jgi:hypothetical protein